MQQERLDELWRSLGYIASLCTLRGTKVKTHANEHALEFVFVADRRRAGIAFSYRELAEIPAWRFQSRLYDVLEAL